MVTTPLSLESSWHPWPGEKDPLGLTAGRTRNPPGDHCHDARKWFKRKDYCNPKAVIVSWLPWF
jgi:hypothetical protein